MTQTRQDEHFLVSDQQWCGGDMLRQVSCLSQVWHTVTWRTTWTKWARVGLFNKYDAQFAGMVISPTLTILLDSMYGITAYQHQGAEEMDEPFHQGSLAYYRSIPGVSDFPQMSISSNPASKSDDACDSDFKPKALHRGRYPRLDLLPRTELTMHKVFVLQMYLTGLTLMTIPAEKEC